MATVAHSEAELRELLEAVKDPEVPVISIAELGVLREVKLNGERVEVVITPTYSGCPAMATIEADVRAVLAEAGCAEVTVSTVLSPAWTTDWMSETAREKLRAYGIAPPEGSSSDACALFGAPAVPCPRCRSSNTRRISEFGSTACKAQYQCSDCLEPFDYFKCI